MNRIPLDHGACIYIHTGKQINEIFSWDYIKQEKGVSKKCTSITRLSHLCRGQLIKCISYCTFQYTVSFNENTVCYDIKLVN